MKKYGRGFIWTKEDEQYLKDNYSTQNKKDLIKFYNKSWNAITRKASNLGLKRDIKAREYNRGWSEEETRYLIDNYEFGDIAIIAKKLNRTKKAITERAKLLKITRDPETTRKLSQKYKVNEDFFKNWSDDMAYVLGIICADGNISKVNHGNRVSVVLHIDDEYLIKEIYNSMESNHKTYYSKNTAILSIDNKHIYNDLLNLGIIPNKSKTLGHIKVPKTYKAAFIRGVLDGDGSVDSKNKRAKIVTASKEFADCLSKTLYDIDIDHKIYNNAYSHNNKLTDFYVIRIIRRQAVKKLYELTYKDAKLFLKRKKKSFEKMGIKSDNFSIKNHMRFVAVKGVHIKTGKTIKFNSLKEASKNGFARTHIYSVTKGRYKQYKGYTWEYI